MKTNNSIYKIVICVIVLMTSARQYAQHFSKMNVEVNTETKILTVQQELTFFNQSNDTLKSIVLNDWNNAYSNKNSPLAKRFSDEFSNAFHTARIEELGYTSGITIIDENKLLLNWIRTQKDPDFIEVVLREKILPFQKVKLNLTYYVKIPSDKFTGYGYKKNGDLNLKNWYLTPARYANKDFTKYNDQNVDDIPNADSDYEIQIKIPEHLNLQSDLEVKFCNAANHSKVFDLSGKNRLNFSLFISTVPEFQIYRNDKVEILNSIKSANIDDIQKAVLIDKIVRFVNDQVGQYPYKSICVSQTDYEKNPFYGLNQLPSFISPFPDDFVFEIKFLKTYINNFLKTSISLDARKDNWIFDGIQVYLMMDYIRIFHPEMKMLGNLSNQKLFASYNLTNLDFNQQYSYLYLLMARKNLDQPLGDPKNTLIKFNQQIANKYKAGLCLNYLDGYLNNHTIDNSIREFYVLNREKQTERSDFESILKKKSGKNIDWFFNTLINSRAIVDYKFVKTSRTKDSITFTIKNKTGTTVPIPVYGLKDNEVYFKQWYENISTDSTFTIPKRDINKMAINYKGEVPEYNLRNNWHSCSKIFPNNRPYKFVFIKDLEDHYYNQILYMPTLVYNFYDGFSPGIRLNNNTILEKTFVFDINPVYSPKTNSLIGSFSTGINKYYRNSNLYNVRYSVSGSTFHYEPDASYYKFNPQVTLRFRPDDYRDNRKEMLLFREVLVDRQKSIYSPSNNIYQNYNVFNVKYLNSKTEITKNFNFSADFQTSSKFGKVASEIGFRKNLNTSHQVNLRLYTGVFLFNHSGSDFFSFGLDKPTDYLFDYGYYGRSETTGFFSQQFIMAEGGFKSKLNTPYANQWMTTVNSSYNIWNWIEVYGDLGIVKNKDRNGNFVFDSGLRLNFLPNYFELYLPIVSSNGWEISQPQYSQKIRFILTLEPKALLTLFSRKWF